MDKIKSILSPGSKKDDEAMYDTGSRQDAAGASGKLSGEGTHFGTGGTGTDSAGYSLGKNTSGHGYSAAEPTGNTDSAGYALGRGSEAMDTRKADSHMNTASAASDLGPTDGSGQAAAGQTSTYSSYPLSTGDKTSRIINPRSSEPNTSRSSEITSTGVGPDAAEIAARRAYDPPTEHMPGGYPADDESSNPYASSTLDPRVDSAGHAPVRQSHAGRDAALGAGAGAAGVGAYEASRSHDQGSSTTAPSTLTSTTNPAERSATYGSATESRGLDSATPATESSFAPATTSTPATTTTDDSTPKKGMVGTVLGALGLGGGAAAVAKHEHDDDSAVDSTTTGVGSYSTPLQSGAPPSHHRKESIPTTAYPAGNLSSVKPIAGPTGQAPNEGSTSSHYGRDAAIGGGALGVAGLGAHEYEKSREPTGGTVGTSSAAPNSSTVHDVVTSGTAPTSQTSGTTLQSTAPSSQTPGMTTQSTGATSGPGTGLAATAGTTRAVVPGAPSSTTRTGADDDSHHYGRDAAIGGGALGAAGLGAHEYEKTREPAAATTGVTPSSMHYGNQPITGQGTKDFSDKVDPRTDTSGYANRGTGVGAVPTATSGRPEDQHHYGRDAAVVGGGAAAAGYGAHEISEHDASKAEKERNRLQKPQAKEIAKEQKAHEKEIKKEQKAEAKAEKKHEKEVAKEEKKQEKLAAKEEKQHEKEGAAAVGAGAVATGGAYGHDKHHQSSSGTTGGGLAASEAADREAYNNNQNHYGRDAAIGGAGIGAVGAGAYEAEKHHGSSQIPSTTGTSGVTHGTHQADPYYNRQPVSDSVVQGQQTGSNVGTDSQHHYGRDAAIGGAGAAALGGGAYEAEKHHHAQSPTSPTSPTSTGHDHRHSSGAADEHDQKAYGRDQREKKPSFFKRIFKRKKNPHTGESEDDEDNYEDVPHDQQQQHHGTGTAGSSTAASPTSTHQPHQHVIGEITKPSYNPFKKEDPNVQPVEGRL